MTATRTVRGLCWSCMALFLLFLESDREQSLARIDCSCLHMLDAAGREPRWLKDKPLVGGELSLSFDADQMIQQRGRAVYDLCGLDTFNSAMDAARFIALRPYLYHLTARENLARIRRTASLESASRIATAAGSLNLPRTRRRQHVIVSLNGENIVLRDQAPLHQGNIEFADGWTYADFVESLNGRVFFWPGGALGAIAYGRRHFERYRAEEPIVVRVRTAALLHANPQCSPLFCAYNSGSPRCSFGRPSPRGPKTFLPACAFTRPASAVVEVTFVDVVTLPADAE